ncbi:MAG: DUF4493 domain-containing protein [Bacteroidales bacterium]|nr:DUF4493 domain-containing protein [Bacteroidales bacterium]
MGVVLLWIVAEACVACYDENATQVSASGCLHPQVVVNSEVTVAANEIETTMIHPLPTASELTFNIKDLSGRYEATWPSVDDYPQDQELLAGDYLVEAYYGSMDDEGMDKPYFYGATECSVTAGAVQGVVVESVLINSVIEVEWTSPFSQSFSASRLIFHAEGGGYLPYTIADEGSLLYLRPGSMAVYMVIDDGAGREACVKLDIESEIKSHHYYHFTVSLDEDEVVVSLDEKISTDDIRLKVDDSLWTSASPQVFTYGFTTGEPVVMPEGDKAPCQLLMVVKPRLLKSLVLTVQGESLPAEGLTGDWDLMTLTSEQKAAWTNYGLTIQDSADSLIIDYTELAQRLSYVASAPLTTFTLVALGVDDHLSLPSTLEIESTEVALEVLSVDDVVIGINQVEMEVASTSNNLAASIGLRYSEDGSSWSNAQLLNCTKGDDDRYRLAFEVGLGVKPLEAQLTLCGRQRATLNIERVAPPYSVSVDAYAYYALLKIEAADEATTEAVAQLAHVYKGDELLTFVSNNPSMGLIIVGGLEENKSYTLRLTLWDDPTETQQFSDKISFTTERARQLSNASFEDVEESISYKNLECGGRYSQTLAAIFNGQNYKTFSLDAPTKWATVNAKTFYRQATNKNTWYMAPSTYTTDDSQDGYYGVKIDNVGWDPAGEEIPDYLQQDVPYLKYNPNIPNIRYKAAGKLFLGSYSIDMNTLQETYDEGVSFDSRPSALNGYYKYLPTPSDLTETGIALVEVIGIDDGAEVVIARGSTPLTAVTGYTAFKVPLDYTDHFGIKATRLKVMLSSSAEIGSIAHESEAIILQYDAAEGEARGASLWIDQLTLSY